MALEITNKIRSTSLIRVVEDSESVNTITANIALTQLATTDAENVLSASIKGVIWTTDGVVNISRGGEVVLTLHGSGEMRLDDFAYSISKNSGTNIIITSANTTGTVIVEVAKDATYTPPLVGM
jgi:hypothetical protein